MMNNCLSVIRGSFILITAYFIIFNTVRTSYVPFIIISLEAVEILRFSSILKEKPYANLDRVIFHLTIIHISLFNIF
jgi:hypothetical protein